MNSALSSSDLSQTKSRSSLLCKLSAIRSRNANTPTILLFIVITILSSISISTSQSSQSSETISTFVDSSKLKPSIILVLPQSFKVPTSDQLSSGAETEAKKAQQFVAVINNVKSERDDRLLRQQYRKLTLQVRDAQSPITGQLFFEHVFDYFPAGSQHLLVPINLDQVSPVHEQLAPPTTRSYAAALNGQPSEPTIIRRPQQLIISIRPYQLDSGFGSDSIEFVSSLPVPVEAVPSNDGRRSFALVQTDKPIYKPEDKVRIRSLVINEDLRPVVNDELRLQVRNPHKIIVEEMRFPLASQPEQASQAGKRQRERDQLYLDHVFEFPPEPMLGTWTVHLFHDDPVANDTTSFEVQEYVLPTYEVEFQSPKYILPSTEIISGSIVAKYHYGKPVQGKANFKFGYKESGSARPRFIARSEIKEIDLRNGKVEYRIKTAKFKETTWFPDIAGSRLYVEATVTETSTGRREVVQDSSAQFITQPYKISFEDTIEDFKPGLSQQLTVRVLEMQTLQPAPAGVLISAQYRDQNGTVLGTAVQATNNQPVDLRQSLDTEALTDAAGRATFNIGPIESDIRAIQVTLRWLNSTAWPANNRGGQWDSQAGGELAVGHHTLVRHESRNGWISLMNKSVTHLRVGEQFVSELLVRDASIIPQKTFSMVVSRGKILSLDSLGQDGRVRFSITERMMPSIRVILFALTSDSVGLLSDSMRIHVDQDLNCGLQMRYKSSANGHANVTTFKPNDKGKIAIQARANDLVSLIGVDSAVYTLNNRSRLDSSRVVERIRRLDSGCGFGGGRNNLDVFHNAGLMLFRDLADTQPGESSAASQIGSACWTVVNQLKYLEDVQLGYSRPMMSAAMQLHRSRPLELDIAIRQRVAMASPYTGEVRGSRAKREIDPEDLLKRYKSPQQKSCCHLGTLEDQPQQRNCMVRAKIVERYMRRVDFSQCASIYLECCRAIFERVNSLSILPVHQRNFERATEPPVQSRSSAPLFKGSPQSEPNLGHLDMIESQTLVRKDFRETWLFDVVEVDHSDGSASLDIQLPHSITSWSISALALNRYEPMCIMAQPLRLITFQDIFLQITMPYKVIQGEQIDLVATIFNYSPETQDVRVYMYGLDDVCSEAEAGERSERRRLRIDPHSSQSLLFPMIPLKVGKYSIKILAITDTSGTSDIVEKTLNVVSRGKLVTDETTFSLDPMNHQRRNKRAIHTGNLMDEIDSSKGLQRSRVRLTPSRDAEYIVPQTQECIVSAIGDRMGQSVQTTMLDVENLIRLPRGCGEQVMIYLGPTLYTTRYLSATNKLTGDLRWRAIRYIQNGYKRILNFRKESGAFSAFARRDPSIWLTAFVAKMLCQTERTQFVAEEIHVDRTVVNSALDWLVDAQNKQSGTWTERSPVYHREMLGGVLKENLLTAFVTVTLNECAHHSPDLIDESAISGSSDSPSLDGFRHPQTNGVDKLKAATQRAEQALELSSYKAVVEKNPYVLALTAYALSYSKPQDAVGVLNNLLLMADRSQSRNQLYWRGDYSIETAAYALQALIELAPLLTATAGQASGGTAGTNWLPGTDAIAIANWLGSRRSFSGAFESTQDTVVGLEALSKFAQLQSSPGGSSLIPAQTSLSNGQQPSLTCNVTISNRTRRSIEFGKDNAQVLQTFRLDSFELETPNGDILDIMTSGNGLGTMSVKLKYNVFNDDDDLCRFDIDSTIEEWQPKLLTPSDPKRDSPTREDMKESSEAKGQSNETIEDDYFKTFDKSMLGELNLIDMSQGIDGSRKPSNAQPTTVEPKRAVLRLRRNNIDSGDDRRPTIVNDSSSTSSSAQESWTSKVVSSIKAKLPSWLTPRPAVAVATTTTTVSTSSARPAAGERSETSLFLSDAPSSRRLNTSRRSAQSTGVPMIVHPTGIPADAKMNALGKQLDLNETIGITKEQQMDLSRRLILLLRICVHHISSRRDSEMSVIEIGILSGFKPSEADLKEIMSNPGTPAMKYELSADRSMVIIYMQYIPSSGPYCLQFRLVRDSLVYNLQSGYIRVYEYYSPAHSCSNYYTPSRFTDLIETKCDSTGQVCQCATKSLCPATQKLLDLGEIHSVNATSARNQLIELVCSNRYDLVSLVRLKSVRHLEAASMYKLSVKVKSDLKGNLTKIIEAQRHQKAQLAGSVRKPLHVQAGLDPSVATLSPLDINEDQEADSSLDLLTLSVDASCVRNDPLLLHLAYPNQWKQGGELMVLFAKSSKLEKRYYKTTPKQTAGASGRIHSSAPSPLNFPRPKPAVLGGSLAKLENSRLQSDDEARLIEAQMAAAAFDNAQQLQYSIVLPLGRDSILHDVAYQARTEPREPINSLILWLELRSRHEKWSCPPLASVSG